MALGVDGRAALELPAQQRPAHAPPPVVGPHPTLQVDVEGVPERGGRERGGVADDEPGGVAHRDAVLGQVRGPAGPPLREVVGVGVLAGVVDLLGGGQQRGDRGDVVGLQRAGGEALGQRGKVGHGTRG